jgi:hypothetical protein
MLSFSLTVLSCNFPSAKQGRFRQNLQDIDARTDSCGSILLREMRASLQKLAASSKEIPINFIILLNYGLKISRLPLSLVLLLLSNCRMERSLCVLRILSKTQIVAFIEVLLMKC